MLNALPNNVLRCFKQSLNSCRLCPHQCGANRNLNALGYCRSGSDPAIASICLHQGEEPPISGSKGICNLFFMHCNLQCVYCQNMQISSNSVPQKGRIYSIQQAVDAIIPFLDQGIPSLGFVSPGHYLPQMIAIIDLLWKKGYKPSIVYNTNAYDRVSSLKMLEGLVDVYLPDYKYSDKQLAQKLSAISNYPEIAHKAIAEMFRQKGTDLKCDAEGNAFSGVIVRHLVLPGFVDQSEELLKLIASTFGTDIYLSLMAQYYPPEGLILNGSLMRSLKKEEYNSIVHKLHRLGFSKGWVQDLESNKFYRPDFDQSSKPFGN